MTDLLRKMMSRNEQRVQETYTFQKYLELCKADPKVYASAHERLLDAIGEPIYVDTSKDARLGRIFLNQTVKVYPSFSEFYGMESTISQIVGFLTHAKQGLEEQKQILYLLGPVGGGKSSLAEHIKKLMEKFPIYVLKYGNELSPVFESPLGLFTPEDADQVFEEYGIPRRLINGLLSPWAVKRLQEANQDVTKFSVVKMYPSKLTQVGIMKVEPGDENNQDISSIVGKVDIRKLEKYTQNDADAYSYSGGLNRSTQGMMEFVEMFKAPIKMLHPLLTATQEGNYNGTEAIGAIPFNGLILAHSNEAEWQTFKGAKQNEAFIDRIFVVKVPYCLRVTEEQQIYEKLISKSELAKCPCAPGTKEMLARFAVLSRLNPELAGDNQKLFSKMRIYDGESLKETDPNAKPITEYRDAAGETEGMTGLISTRDAYKILAQVYNKDPHEISADPVHLMYVLEMYIRKEQFPKQDEEKLLGRIKEILAPKYAEFIGKEIQGAYLESYDEFGQNLFDNYISYADAWIEDVDFKDPDTGAMFNRETLDKKCSEIEKPSNIVNSKDFRNEIVKFTLRARANNGGKNPDWKSFEKIKTVIQKKMFSHVEELLPIISFGTKKDSETEKKHHEFVKRMMERGYSEKQIRRLTEWYMRVKQA